MKRYLIERDQAGAGSLTVKQVRDIGQISNEALRESGPGVQWVQSFFTADRIYCHYLAENEDLIREHAKRAGFACTKISEVVYVVDPMTQYWRVGKETVWLG
jgi:uncharacterized protein DUF4242